MDIWNTEYNRAGEGSGSRVNTRPLPRQRYLYLLKDALFDAVESGDLAEVERLLDAGADPVATMRISGWAPLHEACYHGHPDIARLLLERGADVNVKNKWNDTSLHVCWRDNIDSVVLLLDHGADVNARNFNNLTPLHKACGSGRAVIAPILLLLLDRGADVNARDKWKQTPLHWACPYGHHDIARMLLDRGADVNARDKHNNTPLHVACFHGHPDIARLLLDRGADPGAQGKDGRTPLDLACDLPEDEPARQPLMEAFQELAPEAYFTKFCESQGKTPGRGM